MKMKMKQEVRLKKQSDRGEAKFFKNEKEKVMITLSI